MSAIATSTALPGALSGLIPSFDISSTVTAVQTVLRNPSANTPVALLLLSSVVVLVVILVLFALLLLTPSRRRIVKIRRYAVPPEGTPSGDVVEGEEAEVAPAVLTSAHAARLRKPPGKVLVALTGSTAIAVLVLLGAIGMYVATSTDAYCARTCHAASSSVERATAAGHASCVACHEENAVLGAFANASSRARMLLGADLGHSVANIQTVVDSNACLGCHRDLESGTVTSTAGVRMSHREVLAAGRPCTLCHAGTGHTKDDFTATMPSCLPCHDSRTASAECSTCHTNDPASLAFVKSSSREQLGGGRLVYPAVRAANRDCGGCHDQPKQCDKCHGIRMPHSRAFIEGGHAIAAAFERKLMCWKCHDPQWCGGCHAAAFIAQTGQTTHGANWKQEHKAASWSAGCVCHSHTGFPRPVNVPICTLCHAKNHRLLPVKP